jgi:predicted short-subunit dehydrogenase-like oxidoreductase (DUF2520 family)
MLNNIVIIGSGNLATNLALALFKSGKNILSIYSRKIQNARTLAGLCNSNYSDRIEELPKDADIYFITTSDSAIKEIAEKLTNFSGILVHTSGSIPLSVFSDACKRFGVFYPLMIFSKSIEVSFKDIPICLEANSRETYEAMYEIAKSISNNISEVPSEKRSILHLAAVVACNFTNLNYSIADDILIKNHLSFDLLKPLILETAKRTMVGSPFEHQTGPAIREDYDIIQKHLEILSEIPDYQKMYDLLSQLIISLKHNNG